MNKTRTKTYFNPLGLCIGDTITAKRICTIAYQGTNKRLFYCDRVGYLIVVGVAKRALGKYICNISDYMAPPYLKVSKYIWLYQCKTTINGPIILVHPDDVEIAKIAAITPGKSMVKVKA